MLKIKTLNVILVFQEKVNELIQKAKDTVVCKNDQVKCADKDNSEL